MKKLNLTEYELENLDNLFKQHHPDIHLNDYKNLFKKLDENKHEPSALLSYLIEET